MREWYILLEWRSQTHLITISHISTPLIIISVICHLRFSTVVCVTVDPKSIRRFLFLLQNEAWRYKPKLKQTELTVTMKLCALSLSYAILSRCSNFHLRLISTPQEVERGNESSSQLRESWVKRFSKAPLASLATLTEKEQENAVLRLTNCHSEDQHSYY